jgi:hypothetical protein
MSTPLRALVLEDRPADYELMLHALRAEGYQPNACRVDEEAAFLSALAEPGWDVILADYTMPQFNALRALELLQARELDVPFVVVTGSIGEEQAVECMRRGASDYLLKDRLARLGSSVAHALTERQLRRDRAAAVAGLAERESHFRALIEKASDAIALFDRQGTVQYVSPSIGRMLGYVPEELVGHAASEFCQPSDVERLLAELTALANTPGATMRFEMHVTRKGGGLAVLDATLTNLLRDQAVRGVVCNIHDITERLELERQFHHAQKLEAIGRLAGKIAHDFRNHLTVINGYCQMSLMDLDPGHPVVELITEAYAAGRRAADLAQQLLTFSRREHTETEVFDCNERLNDTIAMLSQLVSEKVTLQVQVAPEPAWVRTDPAHVDQMLMNLAVNASDAMPEGGTLTIGTVSVVIDAGELAAYPMAVGGPGRYLRLTVSDTGTGMPPEVMEHLFEPFFTTKEAGKGTGLGLATVYGMVIHAGGLIDVHSQPGEGTTFQVHLPQLEQPTQPRAAAPHMNGILAGDETILVIEDEPSVLMLVRSVLGRLGYRVLETAQPEEAFRILGETAVHLVLSDVVMPGINGPELVQRLRGTWPDLQVLFMSGYAGSDLTDVHQPLATERLLRKPFTPDQLGRAVREALDAV